MGARHVIYHIVYGCSPRHPPHSVLVLAASCCNGTGQLHDVVSAVYSALMFDTFVSPSKKWADVIIPWAQVGPARCCSPHHWMSLLPHGKRGRTCFIDVLSLSMRPYTLTDLKSVRLKRRRGLVMVTE